MKQYFITAFLCITVFACQSRDVSTFKDQQQRYSRVQKAKSNGQSQIPVHIFPTHLDTDTMVTLQKMFATDEKIKAFWKNIQVGYKWFEKHKTLPKVSIDINGRYKLYPP